MFKKDIDEVKSLHLKYNFISPILDAGGSKDTHAADYDISKNSAYNVSILLDGKQRTIKIPNNVQDDRYVYVGNPWDFLDSDYKILNPEDGDPFIEDLPSIYENHFNTVILVSVLEHVNNPYKIAEALYKIVKPGGYVFNSAPFVFPEHHGPEDNWRFSELSLRRIHEDAGFECVESGKHIKYTTGDGIGDTNPERYLFPQAIEACYVLARKPLTES